MEIPFFILAAPTRGDFFPVLAVLVPLDVLLLVAGPILFFLKHGPKKRLASRVYWWAGILNFIIGIALLILPLLLFVSYVVGYFIGTNPPWSWTETLLRMLVWIAIPGVPLLMADLHLRISHRLNPAEAGLTTL
jgi:hypothetical protein